MTPQTQYALFVRCTEPESGKVATYIGNKETRTAVSPLFDHLMDAFQWMRQHGWMTPAGAVWDVSPPVQEETPLKSGEATVLAPSFTCHVGDTLKLVGVSETGIGVVAKYGPWFRITAGAKSATQPNIHRWYCQSLSRKEQGLPALPKGTPHHYTLWVENDNDPHFRIALRHVGIETEGGKAFHHKDYA